MSIFSGQRSSIFAKQCKTCINNTGLKAHCLDRRFTSLGKKCIGCSLHRSYGCICCHKPNKKEEKTGDCQYYKEK